MLNAASFEASVIVALTSFARVVTDYLEADEQWASVPGDLATQRTSAQTLLTDAQTRLEEMAMLVKKKAIKTDDPDFLSAVAERDVAEAEYERLCRQNASHRESLAELVAAIESLAVEAPAQTLYSFFANDEEEGERAVRVSTPGIETSLRVLRGWMAADFEQQRATLAKTLDTVLVGDDELTLSYKHGLPAPIATEPAFESSERAESACLRGGGFGVDRFESAAT
jgi:hypothetical protein